MKTKTTDFDPAACNAGFDAMMLDELLRVLVDVTWGHAYEDGSVPSAAIQTMLIERARAITKGDAP